jgi:quercetin 2,3-dioxygenase
MVHASILTVVFFYPKRTNPIVSDGNVMSAHRRVTKLLVGRRTSDGAGVRLTRMFSNDEARDMDPFLLLDLFGSDRVEDYIAGFPLHPHRGIETVTYMLDGNVDHKDTIGNQGTIGPGDVQWMTAGSGIMHEEMPRPSVGWMRGFQLWINLPRASKMTPQRYRGISKESIPLVDLGNGTSVKVIAGDLNGIRGPVRDLTVETEYLDVKLVPEASLERKIPSGMNTFAMVYDGSAIIGDGDATEVSSGSVALLGDGELVRLVGGARGSRVLLVSGRPLREPIAWGGPIVMNTDEELVEAFAEIRRGTFIQKNG